MSWTGCTASCIGAQLLAAFLVLHCGQISMVSSSRTDEALWREDETYFNQNANPVAHKDLTLENYDLDDWEPTHSGQI